MQAATAFTRIEDSAAAGRMLGRDLMDQIGGPADALVVFAGPGHDHPALLHALADTCPARAMLGASSAGEFAEGAQAEGTACALALVWPQARFALGLGRGMAGDPTAAARAIVAGFHGQAPPTHSRTALVLTDALAGHAQLLLEELTLATSGRHQFFGGGAGDNGRFRHTVVFHGTEVVSDAAVALEIVSPKPLGIGVGHGWEPAGPALRVTESEGLRLAGLNGLPAVEAFEAHAGRLGRCFDRQAPRPFFLNNVLGIEAGGFHRLRVPLAIDARGGLLCAAEVPQGSLVHIMRSSAASTVAAAGRAARAALAGLDGYRPGITLFFDCVATRRRLGAGFADELAAVRERIGAPLLGCNTHGQFARADGQFEGFHNCTAVVCILPK
ncbi:FIST domain protein [Rhodovastum atsumiense]|uniref:FIST domain protein n=1 Tax=Rhodovastum atsumiense TaxID=504468 RepID=A0A5M6IIW5_9PROT|nr:FIST N-terminal domain-containing protein [Rhodovastum atsumiense]KAA5608184.1 FIST domain protein [Rhodovastum atsumiense]CAH2602550.1 FIST domain protein [Rhodovastum atsumiense]